MIAHLNTEKFKNQKRIDFLIKNEKYIDRGWANSGNKMNGPVEEVLDLSVYKYRGTHEVYISHTTKELIHVDMSD